MVFSSLTFTFFFLPIFLILYFSLPFKNMLLLIFSLIFYAWGEPVYILLMLFSSVADYTIGRKIESSNKKKFYLLCSIVINLLVLCFFKYSDFLIDNINLIMGLNISNLNLGLPIGISFFTFQTMSYSIDVYKGDVKAEKNFFDFFTYVCMFPQLVAGPIVRYETVCKELHERTHSLDNFFSGLKRFLEGLFKKVLLANSLGLIFTTITASELSSISVLSMWLSILCFSMQIYFDFSGYSDMAIGIGKMLGFNYPENFNYPFSATSISDFWRRWHISLGSWFRDYVYIPLGGNRNHVIRNLFIVWFLTGLWHGASYNFILWGLYFGVLLFLEKKVFKNIKLPIVLKRLFTILLVLISFYIFAFDNFNDLLNYGNILFGMSSNEFINNDFLFYLSNNCILLTLGMLFCFPIKKIIDERFKNGVLIGIVYFALYLITISQLVGSSYNPFLYFRF